MCSEDFKRHREGPMGNRPGTGFMENNFSMDQGWEGWFQDDSSTSPLLFTLLLLH